MFKILGRRSAVLVMVVLLLAAVPVASAQDVRSGGTLTVPEGTVVEGDLAAFGGTVVVAGTVDGDVEGLAGSVLVTETGVVTGDISVSAGSVVIQGVVEGSLSGAAGDVTVTEGARVGGDLQVGAGSLAIDGSVGGTVEAGVASLAVGPTATIGGDLRYDAEEVLIADGAVVGGVTERVDGLAGPGIPFVGDVPTVDTFAFVVFAFLANMALAVVVLLAAPGFARRVVETGTDRAAASGLAGLATAVAVPVLLVLAAVTVVGLPLSIAGVVVSLPVLWVAYVYGALVTGSWLLSYADVDSRYAGVAAGLAVAALAAFVPFGGLLTVAYLLLGLGAFALSALDLRLGRGRGGTPEGDDDAVTPEPGVSGDSGVPPV